MTPADLLLLIFREKTLILVLVWIIPDRLFRDCYCIDSYREKTLTIISKLTESLDPCGCHPVFYFSAEIIADVLLCFVITLFIHYETKLTKWLR